MTKLIAVLTSHANTAAAVNKLVERLQPQDDYSICLITDRIHRQTAIAKLEHQPATKDFEAVREWDNETYVRDHLRKSGRFCNCFFEIDRFSVKQDDIRLVMPIDRDEFEEGGYYVFPPTWTRVSIAAALRLAVGVENGLITRWDAANLRAIDGCSVGPSLQTPYWKARLAGEEARIPTFDPPAFVVDLDSDLDSDSEPENNDRLLPVFITAPISTRTGQKFLTRMGKAQEEFGTDDNGAQTRCKIMKSFEINMMKPDSAGHFTSIPSTYFGWTVDQVYEFVKKSLKDTELNESYAVILDEHTLKDRRSCLFIELDPYRGNEQDEKIREAKPDLKALVAGNERYQLLRMTFMDVDSVFANLDISNMDFGEFYDWSDKMGGILDASQDRTGQQHEGEEAEDVGNSESEDDQDGNEEGQDDGGAND